MRRLTTLLLLVAVFQLLFACCAKRVLVSSDTTAQKQNKIAVGGMQVETIDKIEAYKMADEQTPKEKNDLISKRIHSEIIYPGDELEILIYEKLPVSDEKRMERKRVNEAGRIVIPPVGEIDIAGLSVISSQKKIEEKLQPYIVSPFCEIFISKRRYEPQIYVFGEVGRNGTIAFTKGDRLMDALSQAGGCKEEAYSRSIKVIRTTGQKVIMYSVNLKDIFEAGRVDQNLALEDQDIIYVPRRFLTNFREVTGVLSLIMPWYYYTKLFFPSLP